MILKWMVAICPDYNSLIHAIEATYNSEITLHQESETSAGELVIDANPLASKSQRPRYRKRITVAATARQSSSTVLT